MEDNKEFEKDSSEFETGRPRVGRGYAESSENNYRGEDDAGFSNRGDSVRRYDDRRNDGGSDRQEFSKDRDLRRNKFKKYDKIAARKLEIDYKKPEILQEFLTEKGKILSRIITGCSAQNQRKLTQEVKRARYVGLLSNG